MTNIFEIDETTGELTILWLSGYWNTVRQTAEDHYDELGSGFATDEQIREYVNDGWRKDEEDKLGASIPDHLWNEYVTDLVKAVNEIKARYQELKNNLEILQWIENYQKGKSGIYPYQVALQVCATFQISITEAQSYVMQHIKNVMNNKEI